MFYTRVDEHIVFGSEIKAILKYPSFERKTNMIALDQVLSFPGIVSPVTMFSNVESLKPGHFLLIKDQKISLTEYWDLDYPDEDFDYSLKKESYYIERLEELLLKSVQYRLNADVEVGYYLSGGLDSSLIAAMAKRISGGKSHHSFSITFPESENRFINEREYQRLVASQVGSKHHEIDFYTSEIEKRLKSAVFHSECALKETYNTCSLALSENVSKNGIKVILSGEGADEFLGGYVGYRFDMQRRSDTSEKDLAAMMEDQVRMELWGDPDFFYEKNYWEFEETKKSLYSNKVNESFNEINSVKHLKLNKKRINNKSIFHKRSYVDFKLRLCDHLISDHCDRVAYAHSVEGRYPFLDTELIEFITQIPPEIKLKNMIEKHILKEVAVKYVPKEIINRQKFGFVAPGSPDLLKKKIEWVQDMLSADRIKRQGYFNPETIEHLKKHYSSDNFKLNLPYENDLLITVLTFNIWLDLFEMPTF
jgi:asparagine synthase (glutamine-hydrolysing)